MPSYSVEPSADYEQFASLAAAEAGQTIQQKPTRMIRCLADGTLVVKQPDGTQRTLTVEAGIDEPIVAIGIVASGSSGCVPIKVYR